MLNRVLGSDLSWPSYPTTGVLLIPRVGVVGAFPETSVGARVTRLLQPPEERLPQVELSDPLMEADTVYHFQKAA